MVFEQSVSNIDCQFIVSYDHVNANINEENTTIRIIEDCFNKIKLYITLCLHDCF
jgi:hypothetical protein